MAKVNLMNRPTLLVMMGLPASGKSTVARLFAAQTGWPVVDRDVIRAAMFPKGLRTSEEKDAASEATLASLGVHLQQDQSCIADGKPYSRRVERAHVAELAERCDADIRLVWVDCPLQEAIRRIEADRQHPGRDGRAELVREVASRWDATGPEVLRLDARLPPEVLAEQLRAAITSAAT